ncbi:hypothetical protein JQC92_22110 [Shewanella sp. 202IG2-18]|uniref:hypothetical protein n=1 Tax=Parashewanella hymeniacidonis TaxID=2807618 RepID=UPI00195FE7A0|nr:hypothetical protein [Parashewanella hymeniacidonis]
MEKDSNLVQRLKAQHAKESEIIQNLIQQQLSDLRQELSVTYQQELNTIKNDIHKQRSGLSWRLLRSRILWPFLIALSLSAGLWFGNWATMRYLTEEIMILQQGVNDLEQQGGKINLATCGKKSRKCVQIDLKARAYGENSDYRVIKGY